MMGQTQSKPQSFIKPKRPKVPTSTLLNPLESQQEIPKHSHHSATVYKNSMFVFGGEISKSFPGIMEYKFEENLWTEILSDSNPPMRKDHACVVVGDCLYVIGGKGPKQSLNDVWKFDLVKLKWTRENTTGDIMDPRFGHSAVVFNGEIYLFGGRVEILQKRYTMYSNELFKYDPKKHEWSRIRVESAPSPRYFHSAVLGDGNMIVFGGTSSFGYLNDVYEFDFKQWKRVKCCGNVPTPRHGHVSVFLNNQMYVFGGFDGSFCNDLYELDIKMKIWNEIELERKCPQRIFCSAVVYDDEMYLYGGTNEGGEYSDELYRVSLPRIGGDRYIAGSFVEMDSYKGSLNAK